MTEPCPLCQGSGFELRSREDGTLASTRCRCQSDDLNERRLRAARIPKRYEHCTLESFEGMEATQREAHAKAREWIELWPAVNHGLLFIGKPGTGKTHLAVAIGRELIRQKGAGVLFYEQRELLKSLRGAFDSASEQRETEILAPVLEAEVLILDDLGAGRTTPWARDVMHDVIAHRYNEEKLMIITSNHLTGDEEEVSTATRERGVEAPLNLRQRLGDALMSRIYEMCRIIRVRGKDDQDYRRMVRNAEISR